MQIASIKRTPCPILVPQLVPSFLGEERLSLACEKAPTDDEAPLSYGVTG